MPIALNYYIADAESSNVLASNRTCLLAEVVEALFTKNKPRFKALGVGEADLELYAPSDLDKTPNETLPERAKISIEAPNGEALDLGDTVDEVFGKKLEKSLIHLVVRVNPAAAARLRVAEQSQGPFKRPRLDTDTEEGQLALLGWEVDTGGHWQEFFQFWKTADDAWLDRPVIPLAYNKQGLDKPPRVDKPHRVGNSPPPIPNRLEFLPLSQQQYIVRASYRTLYDRVMFSRIAFSGGIVVTGQPGTGKTTWLWYMLMRLIRAGESVVFYYDGETRLFHGTHVYIPIPGLRKIGTFPQAEGVLWTLINSDRNAETPPSELTPDTANVFSIHAASPNPKRYKSWAKQRNAFRFGMPLWTEDELVEGIKVQAGYEELIDNLAKALDAPNEPVNSPLVSFRLAMQIQTSEEDSFTGDHRSQAEAIVAQLVRNTIETCGYSARTVYNGIFVEPTTRESIAAELNKYTLEQLEKDMEIIRSCILPEDAPISHQVLAMDVVVNGNRDNFRPKFKSELISKMVAVKFTRLRRDEIRRLIGYFRETRESSTMAGWLFESLVHNILQYQSLKSHVSGSLICMNRSPPNLKFNTADEPSSIELPIRDRELLIIDLDKNGKWWPPIERREHLGIENYFFVPRAPNNPFFDSFFVSMDLENGSLKAKVWFLQVTMQTDHRPRKMSDTASHSINSIVTVAAQRAKELMAGKVEPKYVLVCPLPKEKRSWTFPFSKVAGEKGGLGWLEGDVYCQHIDTESPVQEQE